MSETKHTPGRKTYTRDDYADFIGKSNSANRDLKPLPNVEDVDPLRFLNDLAARGHMMEPVWGYALLPDNSRPQWTQFFLLADVNMSSELGGGGYAVTYGGSVWVANPEGVSPRGHSNPTPIVRRFRICRHEVELHPSADPSRGWHPGRCKLCGVDMTIDSGD